MNKLNSNNINTTIHHVCQKCGSEARKATMKKRGFSWKKQFEISTWYEWICDYCKQKKPVTQTRDFLHPDFSLLNQADYIKQVEKEIDSEIEHIENVDIWEKDDYFLR
jgi:predicted transglutaminase-like cysteine proteinase